MAIDPKRLEAVFNQALLLAASAQRLAYVEKACAGDDELCARVLALLASHDATENFLPRVDEQATEVAFVPIREGAGAIIGRYKLLQQIGEGGFGVVFMAEQEIPLRRKVALKIIKLGMDTRQVIARFEAERQALAMMDHPGIARVLDAGATESGRPYFVMELVRGVPITEYCDKNKLNIAGRLELMSQVCQAVQHAHQKGLIHRDIKPSNVLVSTQDGRPVVKMIDFGIAKATQARLTEKTLFTEFKQLIGTPAYMSPEQAEGSLDIDTRSDIYALGVLLYELLAGTTPFDPKELLSKAYGEMQRIIREVEPPRPSTRCSALRETLASVAACRATEPKKLGAMLRSELDWIVMKALEKDRNRRYESAAALAVDIVHYLADEPISAAAPSRIYRLRKFIRRNRGAVAAGAAIFLTLVAGIIGTSIGMYGQAKQRGVAEVQRGIAKNQAAVAEAVARFQVELFSAAQPERMLGDKVTVLEVMNNAIRELDAGSLKDQPMVEGGVRFMIGNTLRALGRFDEAERNLQRVLSITRADSPVDELKVAQCLHALGMVAHYQGKSYEAENRYRQALEIYGRFPAARRDFAITQGVLAELLTNQPNRLGEAEKLARDGVDIMRHLTPLPKADLANNLNILAHTLDAQDKPADALAIYQEALQLRSESLPAMHPDIAMSLNNIAEIYRAQGNLKDAEPLYKRALTIVRASLPEGHIDIARVLNNYGLMLTMQRNFKDAKPKCEEALTIFRNVLPPGHEAIAMAQMNLGLVYQGLKMMEEAEQAFNEAVEIMNRLPGDHPGKANTLYNLGKLLLDRNRPGEAEPRLREALEALEHSPVKDQFHIGTCRMAYGHALALNRKPKEAESELLAAEQIFGRLANAPVLRLNCVNQIIALYMVWNKFEPGKGYDVKMEAWKQKLAELTNSK